MATLPKIFFNGVRVKNLIFNSKECQEGNFKDGVKDIVKCYHKHKGSPGQSSPNGCYTVKELYGGKCGGHTYTYTTVWSCGYCGTKIRSTSRPSGCTNHACANYGDNNGGAGTWYSYETATRTNYCSSPTGCSNWNWQTRYILGCGYDAD